MKALKEQDKNAEFRFFGGDNMTAVGGERVRHYKDLAYMGFIPVLLHLPTIFRNMAMCKKDITDWQPDVVILVDYAGFNLNIAKYLRARKDDGKKPKVFYYIVPKLWAWKEYRIKNIKRDVLPFEKEFFEGKHGYPIHYVGNPTADEVRLFRSEYKETYDDFCKRNNLDANKPIIALLAGSRRQEIKDNLPAMLEAVKTYPEYQPVLACAPGIEEEYYNKYIGDNIVGCTHNETYALLSHSTAALVTSGTATLETAIFNVPQVVCYKTPIPSIIRWAFNHIIKCKYISLVNLIANKEVVQELFADRFSVKTLREELGKILPNGGGRAKILSEYDIIDDRLGNESAPENAARMMIAKLS